MHKKVRIFQKKIKPPFSSSSWSSGINIITFHIDQLLQTQLIQCESLQLVDHTIEARHNEHEMAALYACWVIVLLITSVRCEYIVNTGVTNRWVYYQLILVNYHTICMMRNFWLDVNLLLNLFKLYIIYNRMHQEIPLPPITGGIMSIKITKNM